METLVEGSQDQKEAGLAFKAGGPQIQINSISIEISSTDINEPVEECKHFSIRGFVAEVRKKNSTLCSPFLSDGDVNGSDTQPLELPPIDTRKFRWWRCSACLQDCNSSQGTSKEIGVGKSVPSQNSGKQRCLHERGCSKGLSKLYARAAANGFTLGSSTSSQRSDKGKQVQDGGCLHEMSKEIGRDPLFCCGNSQGTLPQKLSKGKRLLLDDDSQGPSKEKNMVPLTGFSNSRGSSFLKSISEAVMVPFNGLNYEKATSSRKSEKEHHLQKGSSSRVMSKVVMGPPGGFATPPKSSKEQNLQKSSSSQVMPKEFSMPPPGGFSNSRQNSQKSGKGSRLQHQSSFRGASKDASILPLTGSASGKSTSAGKLSKQQNVQHPKPNARLWQKGETSNAAPSHKKRNYAKRSVQQPESAGDKHEIQKGGENGSPSTSNRESLQHGAAKEDVLLIPERLNDDKVPLQLNRNVEVGSCSKSTEQVSNFSTAGITPDLFEHNRFVKDGGNVDTSPDEDGADKNLNPVRPSSNRLLKKPSFDDGLEAGRNNVYEEEEEEDYRGMRLRRAPKIRLLSDVIAKYPTNVREQPDNSKASPGAGASNDILPVRSVSTKVGEQSSKRKVSPVASRDTSTEKGVSDKDAEQSNKIKISPVGSHDTPAGRSAPVPGNLKKRKWSPQDNEEHLADSLIGGSKRTSVRFAELENKVVHTSHSRSGVDSSAETISITDAKKQSKHILDRTEVEKKSKKARIQNAVSSSVPSEPRQESRDNCDRALAPDRYSLGEAAIVKPPVHGGSVTDGRMDKSLKNIFSAGKPERAEGYSRRNSFPQSREDCQSGNKVPQFGLNNVDNARGDDTSDCIIIGSGPSRRNDVMGNIANSSTPSSTVADNNQTSVLTANELWFPQVQAGGALVERRGGEGSLYTQQKGKTVEAKGRMKDIDINSIPVDDKAPEQGSADDIPMDIVELLAKHQHERRCDANRERLSLLEPIGDSTAQKSYPSMLKPHASYAGSGFGQQFEVMGNRKQISSDNFDTSRKNVLVGYPKDGNLCTRFTGNTQSQGQYPSGAHYSCSAPAVKSWNENTVQFRPSSRGMLQQPMPPFSRYQGGMSQPLNTQIWPPMMQSGIPLTGLANQGMYTQGSEMLHKGKAIQGTINFNFERATIGNPGSGSSQPWNPRMSEYAVGRQKTADFLPPKVMRPVDLSSNETIPAMQLLNLVHVAGNRSSTSPVNGNAEFLKKQYAPGPHFEPYKSTASCSRHPQYDCDGRTSFVDKPCPCSSALPTAQMFSPSAFQNEPAVGKNCGMKNPTTFTGSSSYNALVGDLGSDKPSTQAYRVDKKRKLTSAGKNPVVSYGPLVSGINAVQTLRMPVIDFVPHCDERATVPLSKAEYCMINRNPAEILDLKDVRSFMIGPEDLRRGKGTSAKAALPSRLVPNPKRPQTILNGKGRERLHKS